MLNRRFFMFGTAAIAAAQGCGSFAGERTYPDRAVKIIVPAGPGAGADVLPRIVADALSDRWKRPVVIENRPGAANNIGAELASKAPADGYTLFAAPPPSLVINESLYPRLQFDPHAFVPITVMSELPNVLVAKLDLPASDLWQLIEFAQQHPGELNYGSSGVGTTPHLAMESLKSVAGIKLTHVPYKTLALALTDLLSGHIDVMFDNLPTSLPHIKAGKLNALAIGSKTRAASLPNLPSISETFSGFSSTTWFALCAPPGTPAEIANEIAADVNDVLKQPAVITRFRTMGAEPVGGDPSSTAQFLNAERARWKQVVASAGVHLQ
jgi:tripartite-type tricarboxylate transporter receptor subunit TctC